jgi:predicted negative regulator of RcsB-dependent stress response
MDEDTSIININTRNEKIKNFFIKNKIKLIVSFSLIIVLLLIYFVMGEFKQKKKITISDDFNNYVQEYKNGNLEKSTNGLIEIIFKKDTTYSPLSLYFIIDNNLVVELDEINNFFDVIINETPLEKEIKNLLIYKKGLINADNSDEAFLLDVLNPLINSKSIWKSHALYLVAEYFYSKNEKQKAKEFFSQIIDVENANQDILKEAQKRLNRDLSD